MNVRAQKARAVTDILGDAGMNLGGFSVEASIRLYKSFIEPTVTYGLQVTLLPSTTLEVVNKALCYGLRRIFSASLEIVSIVNTHHTLQFVFS
jgi:hypothetical protein